MATRFPGVNYLGSKIYGQISNVLLSQSDRKTPGLMGKNPALVYSQFLTTSQHKLTWNFLLWKRSWIHLKNNPEIFSTILYCKIFLSFLKTGLLNRGLYARLNLILSLETQNSFWNTGQSQCLCNREK